MMRSRTWCEWFQHATSKTAALAVIIILSPLSGIAQSVAADEEVSTEVAQDEELALAQLFLADPVQFLLAATAEEVLTAVSIATSLEGGVEAITVAIMETDVLPDIVLPVETSLDTATRTAIADAFAQAVVRLASAGRQEKSAALLALIGTSSSSTFSATVGDLVTAYAPEGFVAAIDEPVTEEPITEEVVTEPEVSTSEELAAPVEEPAPLGVDVQAGETGSADNGATDGTTAGSGATSSTPDSGGTISGGTSGGTVDPDVSTAG